MVEPDPRTTIERFVVAYNAAASDGLSEAETLSAGLAVLDEFWAPEFVWVEAPTSLYPSGRRGGRAELTDAATAVSTLLASRRYELLDLVVEEDRVAAEYVWHARFRAGGDPLRIRLAAFYRLRGGQITEAREYPCVEAAPDNAAT